MINESNPPHFEVIPSTYYWERSADPWHPDAFPDEFKAAAPNQTSVRKEGWMAIDGIENPIGFIPDNSDVPEADDFELKEGRYGRMCAYRKNL
jgi:hypothetical protein